MTPREKNLAAVSAIAQQHGYTVRDILGPSRRKHLVHVRRLCILMLRRKGYSTSEIGRVLDRDHTTIVHALNKPVDTCNRMVVGIPDQQRRDDKMINWTKDERATALMANALEHYRATDELSLEHEAQLELIRDEYLNELWNDFRRDDFDAFEEWHSQPTVEEAFLAEIGA
jgi:hypothetical protein